VSAKGNTVGSQLREIVIGSLLGDSFLEQNGKYRRFVCAHGIKQRDYIEWKYSMLQQVVQCKLSYKTRYDPRTTKHYPYFLLRSSSNSIWDEFYELFYINRQRVIPPKLPEIISPLSLAVWIMDDGYRRNDCNALRINTQAYTFEEHLLIASSLRRLGIKSTIHRQSSYLVTYIPSHSMDILRSTVRPYIIPSMEYKIA